MSKVFGCNRLDTTNMKTFRYLPLCLLILLLALPATNKPGVASAQTANTVFAVIGDFGLASQPEADVATLVKSWNPNFIVTVGDNNYPNGATSSIDDNIGQYYHEYIFPYKGKYGAGADTRRFFPALGNHDWGNNGPRPYYNYFSFYNEKGYYDFIQGPVHFFVLNSNPEEPDGTSASSKQAKWLKSGLELSTSSFNIVILHHAPYSSGKHGSNLYTQWPYKDWGADAVLAGHDHIYERLNINGIPYFVNGIGGSDLYRYETILPESQVRFNQDYGAMRVEANSASIKFQMYTRTGVLVDEYILGNSIPAVQSITRNGADMSNAASVDFTVNFSEAVTGVDISDFSLNSNNTFISNVSGASTSYTVTVNTGASDGVFRLDLVDNDSIVNSIGVPLGNIGIGNGSFFSGESYTIDKTPPIVTSILRAGPNPSSAASVDFVVSFSEAVIGVDGSDFILNTNGISGASILNFSGSGASYMITANTGVGNDNLRLDLIDDDSIADVTGNKLGGMSAGNGDFNSGEMYTINKAAPSVVSITRVSQSPTNAQRVDFAVTFSEAVSGVDNTDFILNTSGLGNTSISGVNGMGAAYLVSVDTGTGDNIIGLELIDNNSIINGTIINLGGAGVGNGNFSASETYMIDKTAPVVTSIIRASQNPASDISVDFIVTFSEPVVGVDTADFTLSTNNINNASVSIIKNVDPFYIVTANTGIGNGTIRLDLIDNDGINDLAGNLLGGIGAGNGNFLAGEFFDIAKVSVNFPAPTIRGYGGYFVTNDPTPTFSWSVIKDAQFYEVVIAADENFTQVTESQIVNNLSYSSNISLPDATYYWHVRAYNANAQPGKFSKTQSFTVDTTPPPAPSLLMPLDWATVNKKPTFQWVKVSSAINYQIEIDNNSDFSSPEYTLWRRETSIRVSGMKAGIYYWRVSAKDSAGNWSEWSAPFVLNIR